MVARVLLGVLVLMSAISWYLIVMKGISQLSARAAARSSSNFFWSATSLEAVQSESTCMACRSRSAI